MTVPHEPWLVALSIAIAVQGSFVGLSLARELERAEGFRRRLSLAGASLTLATGVWSMHFVGMLAANFPSAIDYLVLPTLVSFLICVIVVGVGVYAAHADGPPVTRIGAGAVAMGLGISLMHYVGMSAVHLAGPTRQETPYVVASVAVSIGASALALWALDSRPTKRRVLLGALVLGLAISGMHYTAMAGMRLDPQCFDVSRFVGADSALSRNTLALLTTLVAFGVSGAFLLSLVPDGPTVAEPPGAAISAAPERRAKPPALVSGRSQLVAPPPPLRDPRADCIRVEKDGRWRDISPDEIFAVRANAHYTYIYDGEQEYFCNLSIRAVEERLDRRYFIRAHRSHIIAIRRVARVKRAGENAIAEIGVPVRCSVPIARAQYRQVKMLVEAMAS
jgi:NO-binding membrane sensor protein with MHYT domain